MQKLLNTCASSRRQAHVQGRFTARCGGLRWRRIC